MKRRIVNFALVAALTFSGAMMLEYPSGILSGTSMMVAYADTTKDVTPDTGKLGDCDYEFTSDGVLHIGTGTLPEASINTVSPEMNPKNSPFNSLIRGRKAVIKAISFDGEVQTPPDASYLFYGLATVNDGKVDYYPVEKPQIENWQNLDTSQTTDMTAMFKDSGQKTLDVSHFDTSQVTSMRDMFRANGELTSNIIGLRSKGFDTSQVTDMSSMFNELGNGSFQAILDLSGFNVGNVKENGFSNMFNSSPDAKLVIDFSDWNPQYPLKEIFSNFSGNPVSQLTLSENLDLTGAELAEILEPDQDESTSPYTGRWENKEDRYSNDPNKLRYTSADLMDQYGKTPPTPTPSGNVTYIWEPTKLPVQGKPVTVHYVDEVGQTLQDDLRLNGDAGETYTITPPAIENYQYVEGSAAQLKGIYSSTAPAEVTLTYKALLTPPVVTPTTPGTTTDSSSSSQSSSESETRLPDESAGMPVARKDRAITAVKKMGLYRTPNFSKKTRQFYYAKRARTERPQFVITGVAQSKNGTKRYLVRDVTPGSKRRGQTGYVTAKSKFWVHTYYQTTPKRVKVIAANRVNAYRKVNLKGQVKHYKRGSILRVKQLKRHGLTTRFQLPNGYYVTANKRFVVQK